MQRPGLNRDCAPSIIFPSFQFPGLICFGGAFFSLILPNRAGRDGVTDFLVDATLMVASSSVRGETVSIVNTSSHDNHSPRSPRSIEGNKTSRMTRVRCDHRAIILPFVIDIPLVESIVAISE